MLATLDTIKSRFQDAMAALYQMPDADPVLAPSTKPQFGDYQINGALPLAQKLGDKPRAIAEKLVAQMDLSDLCEPPVVAGPGFINLIFKQSTLESLQEAVATDDHLGVAPAAHPQRVIVDFSGPNIAKEMHVGHLRSTVLGEAVARVLDFLGHDVRRINHVGDWGTQFGMLITFLRETYPQALTDSDAVDISDLVSIYRQAKLRFDSDETFKEKARQQVVLLQAGDPESLHAWKLLCDQSRRSFTEIYDILDVHLTERGESFYNALLPGVVADLDKAGLLTESDGAQCVFVEGFQTQDGDPLPLIVRKTDGGYNYATTDLAAIRYRIQEDHASRLIYVTDMGQGSHFAQVFAVANLAGWVPDNVQLAHVPFGLVQGEDGKKFRTRAGDTVKLRDLLDESVQRARELLEARLQETGQQETEEFIAYTARAIGIAAVKYADLSQNRTTDYVFSYDKMLALQGNTAPYMMYAYARVQGISRKAASEAQVDTLPLRFILAEDTEKALAKHLLQLDEVLYRVSQDFLINRLCLYLFELSQKFNSFYESCPVLGADPDVRASRIALCQLTARTLQVGLSLLGIAVVDRL